MNRLIMLLIGILVVTFLSPTSSLLATTMLGTLTLTAVKCRIFSPNGDGYSDKARFEFDNPEQLPPSGSVYDLTGARVANMKPGTDPTSVLLWDGKDDDGQTVAGGIYIYKIEFEGKTATGTVVVAR